MRAAYGASGVQPGTTDALRYYTSAVANVATQDQPGLLYTSPSNTALRPERSREFETGFDARLFDTRANIEFTYYNKKTTDALVGAVVPPSLGSGNTTQLTNLVSVKNTGFELGLRARLVDRPGFSWDADLNGSTNSNELLTLGVDATGQPLTPQVASTYRNQPGDPLYG